MNSLFFLILCLFLFFGCAKQGQEDTQNLQETQAQTEEVVTEEAKTPVEQEKSKEASGDMTKMRNPFLTQEEEGVTKETGSFIPINYLSLSAVIYSPRESRAIINGQILKVGDNIDNKQVVKIEPEAVILKDAQGEYIVRLKKVAGE